MSTNTATAEATIYVERERDKYGRSLTVWSRRAAEGVSREGACIVRLPKSTYPTPTWLVNTDRVNYHAGRRDHIFEVTSLREAKAIIASIPWVANATTVYDFRR